MKTTAPSRTDSIRWKSALWIVAAAILGLLSFGAAVQVDFVDPEVPLSQAFDSASWSRVAAGLRQKENQVMLVAAIVVLATLTVSRSWKTRVGMLSAGFLIPVYVEGPVMLGAAFISPLMAFNMLAGKVDGEFYGEALPRLTAMGLWMLLCLTYGIREALLILKQPKTTDTGAIKPLENQLP